ncbi:hypothetical protein [Homoserinimonas sp. OAct 916]|uniref:hypothetical protein n=1 Tax=Homoserinimonas sp. OAct 916 TaxID=2211450 RepID=UPI000DBE85B7|nr:hypothetical protein [Homoserinimonas sp. OAct 916]
MSKASASDNLIIGGQPRASLLPIEVVTHRKGKALRRQLATALVLVVLVVATGIGLATMQAGQKQERLAAEQARTQDLLDEQLKYIEVRSVQTQVDTTKSALIVGASTEVDWKAYLQSIRALLPADVTIDTVSIDSASPMSLYPQPGVPLQHPRIATLTLKLTSPALPTVPKWLEALSSLPGYADSVPGTVVLVGGGSYEVNLTIHVNEDAFTHRFALDALEPAEAGN